jgi:opacity protein-like surface antigen
MRRIAAILAGHFTLCGLAFAAAQDLPYPGDSGPRPDDVVQGTYVALRGSLTFDGKGTNASIPTTPTATALRPSHTVGGGAAIAAGIKLPYGFRVETEGLFRKRPVSSVALGGVTTPASGFIDTAASMTNVIWAPAFDGMPIRPMIGGGVGAAYTQSRVNDPAGATTYLQNSRWNLAYQGFAGLEIPVLPGAAITAQYRWMHTDNVTARCGTAGAATLTCRNIGFNDQGVDLGLTIALD